MNKLSFLGSKLSLSFCFIAFAAATASAQDSRLENVVPDSAFTSVLSGTNSETSTYSPSGSNWWVTWDESHVFQRRITHDNSDDSLDWDIRIGKGGQVYSFISQAGEMMPPQYRSQSKGPSGHLKEWAPWIDEVFQTVAINTNLNNAHKPLGFPYFMHGSGVYLKDNNFLTEPFYNPSLVDGVLSEDNSYMTVHWMNQAHIPSYHPSHAITYYKYRDVGDGIIEVTSAIYNFSENDLNYFNFPWGGARTTKFGKFQYKENGILTSDTTVGFPDDYQFDDLGGWILFTDKNSPDGDTLGLVFGEDKSPMPAYQPSGSVLRIGFAGGTSGPANDANWRNYQVSSAVRKINVPVGKAVWARYYFVVGDRTDVLSRINSNNLVEKTDYGLLDITEEDSDIIGWYGDEDGPLSTDSNSGDLQFELFAQPVNNSVPVFKVQAVTGEVFITTDPYALTAPYGLDEIRRPYDGKTTDWELMGYGMKVDAPSWPPSSYVYQALSDLVTPSVFLARGADVNVLVSGAAVPLVFTLTEVEAHGTNLRQVGSDVELSTTEGTASQWHYVPLSDGSYKIINKYNGKRLSAASDSDVSVTTDLGSVPDADRWFLRLVSDDFTRFRIENKEYARWLLGRPSPNNGVELDLTTKTGTYTRWKITDVD